MVLTDTRGRCSFTACEDSGIIDQTSSNLAVSLDYAIKMSELGRS